MFARLARYGLLLGVFASFLLFWLPFVRSPLDGGSYEWGRAMFGHFFGGAGVGGDYWFVAAGTALGVALLYLGWRRPGAAFKGLSVLWSGVMLAEALYTRFVLGEDITFEGATLGVMVPVSTAFIAAYALVFLFALAWAFGGREERPARWGVVNTLLVGTALVLLPAQYLLLSTGQGREFADQFGVLITMGQWLLIGFAFAPFHGRVEQGALQAA